MAEFKRLAVGILKLAKPDDIALPAVKSIDDVVGDGQDGLLIDAEEVNGERVPSSSGRACQSPDALSAGDRVDREGYGGVFSRGGRVDAIAYIRADEGGQPVEDLGLDHAVSSAAGVGLRMEKADILFRGLPAFLLRRTKKLRRPSCVEKLRDEFGE